MPNLNDVLGAGLSNAKWPQIASGTAATVTATAAAPGAGARAGHFVTGWTWSYSGGTPAVATIQLLDGATVIDQIETPATTTVNPIVVEYAKGFYITPGNSAVLTCGSLGTGVKCTIVLRGKTVAA